LGLVLPTVGLSGQVELLVTDADTALSVGTGDVAVLATPRIVALCEQAIVEALHPRLAPGQTSVGFRVEITHLAPVLVGATVVASAALDRSEGRRLTFNVSVVDRCGVVAAGRVTRVLVDKAGFMDRAR
jgi:fluoroacetyl-CoA thioesterase